MAQLSETISPLTGPLRAAVICFFVFQLMGLVFAILALVAGVFSTSSRRASWWNFILSWAVFAFSYTLLLFEGHAFEGTPSRSICMLQSSLTYGAPPFSSACALNLVLESLIAPYVIFITVILISLGVALTDPDVKFTVVAYCSLENHVPGRITAGLVVILIIAVLFFNANFYIAFRRHPSFCYQGFYRSALLRISGFSLFSLFAIIIGLFFFLLAFIGKHNSVKGLMELNVILSLMPVAGTMIFGSHKDLLEALMFWKRKELLNANVQDIPMVDMTPHISVCKNTEKPLPPIPQELDLDSEFD
ncbi:uncharacterized protein C8R40DRAFT_1074776 [Lentinula edodes]|uniref:uncharacterized protein n=1 Tax=Lentinula edodes TaxID=5353 RepID=UPI001E8D4F11|nr:uncharacterized protein C8R40DRAFT_1074776 [Lentinula edodes]KAH7868491.1 hypothetical protein C8R40DRAFT_1074776 [Lentinula edodes]